MNETAEQPLLILGMHRSGTSYLAGLMQSLGVFIGDELVGPQKGNPRGHFEAVPMLEFHQKLIGSRIDDSRRAFDDGMLVQVPLEAEYTDEEKAEAASLITAMRRPGPWGWKEPRTSLFVDLWSSLLPSFQAVMVYRHPLEVHQSLLRRDHWDLSLFPDQAMRAYAIYNQALLKADIAQSFVFNANAGFSNLSALVDQLKAAFSLDSVGELPQFHQGEFQTIRISESLHRLTGLIYPEATAAFDALQERSSIRFEWQVRDDDATLTQLAESLAPVLEALRPEGRACFGPLLDYWASGEDPSIFTQYAVLAEEIGGRVQRVEEWNRQAEEIFKENKRLSADYERMGKEFAKQQDFLAKQAATQAKVWQELTRTGNSWTEQKTMIEDLLKEKRHLLEEVQKLRQQLEERGEAGS